MTPLPVAVILFLLTCRSTSPAAPSTEVPAGAAVDAAAPESPRLAAPDDATSADAELESIAVDDAHPAVDAVEPAPSVPSPSPPFFAMFGGDLMAHDQIRSVAAEHATGDPATGWSWLLREITPIKRRLEALGRVVFVANLEFPVANEREEPRRWPPRFNGPPAAPLGFHEAGVDVVTVANNHAYDQHREGLAETVAAARDAGLRTAGGGAEFEAHAPVFLSEAEPRIAMLAYLWTPSTYRDPSDPAAARVATLDDRVEDEVRAARADADLLFVVVHWIGEFVEEPLPEWREWTERIAAAGADAIVCHGPHVVGPVEKTAVEGRAVPVVFSLGNLVSNMGWGVHPGVVPAETDDSEFRSEARREALATFRIVATGDGSAPGWAIDGLWMIPLWLEDNKPVTTLRGGPLREIFPRPMPWCVPDPRVGCWERAPDEWCKGRLAMILAAREELHQVMWSAPAPALEPCPPGSNAYEPPFEWSDPDGI
ncbi:MAG: CapA family protein [Deltaproteobacteria bacterium]|nr:CapA family protein [Deltaproteobacteria bacterium]